MAINAPTSDQLHTLRHMLGINTPNDRQPVPSRNYAAVTPGDPAFAALEAAGWVERFRATTWPSRYDLFRCTARGQALAMASHRAIRRSAAQRRYSVYLSLRDALDVSFREFLTAPEYADARRQA